MKVSEHDTDGDTGEKAAGRAWERRGSARRGDEGWIGFEARIKGSLSVGL